MALRVKVTEAMRSQLTVFLPSSSSITSSSKLTNDSTDDSDVIGNNNDTISPPPSNEIPESIAILNNSSTQQSSPLSNEEIKKLLSELEKGYLSVSTIKILTTKCGIQCSTLLKGSILTSSQAVEETQTTVPANNALIKRRQYLLAKQQEREYNQMTFGTDINPDKQLRAQDGENPYAQMRNQVTVSTNMIVSIFAMFGVGYLIARNMTDNETTRMIAGLVASIAILVVEMTLYILRAVQMENTFEKNKNQ